MLTGSGWEMIAEAALAGWVYWIWHARRYRQIGCAKCEGKGSFMDKSLVLEHPVKRPCPRCGGTPWRRRKWSGDGEA